VLGHALPSRNKNGANFEDACVVWDHKFLTIWCNDAGEVAGMQCIMSTTQNHFQQLHALVLSVLQAHSGAANTACKCCITESVLSNVRLCSRLGRFT